MSANTLHQPASGADVEVSPTRNLRNVCHVFDRGTQEEDDPGTWEAPMPSGIQGMFAMYWRQSASTQQSKAAPPTVRTISVRPTPIAAFACPVTAGPRRPTFPTAGVSRAAIAPSIRTARSVWVRNAERSARRRLTRMANIASITRGTSMVRQCRLHPSICGPHRRQIGSPDDLLARHNLTTVPSGLMRPISFLPRYFRA